MKKEFAIAKFIRGLLSGGIGGVYCGTSLYFGSLQTAINTSYYRQFSSGELGLKSSNKRYTLFLGW